MNLTWRHYDILKGAVDGRSHLRDMATHWLAYGLDFVSPRGYADSLVAAGLITLDPEADGLRPIRLTAAGRDALL